MTLADDIKAHALDEFPRECCGVVVIIKGRERYIRCRNLAPKPEDDFRLAPEDYADAEDRGEVVAIVHSHPNVSAAPSEADRVSCEQTGLRWLIASVLHHAGDEAPHVPEIRELHPVGYVSPLVGRQFHHGVLDCYTLIKDWYQRERGIELPNFHREDGWWNDGASDLYTENFCKAGFEKIPENAPLEPGDVILMQVRSDNGVPNHGGVYIGDGFLLHHPHGRLSTRDVYGGMWRELTRFVVRRREFNA